MTDGVGKFGTLIFAIGAALTCTAGATTCGGANGNTSLGAAPGIACGAAKIGVETTTFGRATCCAKMRTLGGFKIVCSRLSGRSGTEITRCGASLGSALREIFAGADWLRTSGRYSETL